MADFRRLIREHKRLTRLGLLTIVVALLIFMSRLHVILIIWSFIGGAVLCCSFVNSETLLPNLLRWHVRKKKPRRKLQTVPQQDDELSLLKKVCPVCGKDNCSRHRPELNIVALQPWTNLKVPEKLDAALEEFMNTVLKEFVYTWYRDLGEDEAFVDELRTSLRFIVSVLLRRIKKVDLPVLILNSVLKTAIRHLHFHVQVKRRAKNDVDLQSSTIEYYAAHLHCAARNRQCELDYLRATAERVFPYILPLQSLKCRGLCVLLREILAGAILLPSMDKLADPDIINNLLLVFFDNSQTPRSPPSTKTMSILGNFAQPLGKNVSCLHLELMDILGNQEALFPFMQFMKTEASVNVLQFYLTAEEFNSKMLTPELTQDQLKKLHADLVDLYRMYCAPNAADRIQFDEDIVSQLKDICDGPPEDVIRLQTTTPLFRAYEHAYTLLETTFLPLFHQSDDYYTMLCGERLPTKLSRSLSKANKRPGDALTLSRLGSKIKGVFKSNTVEGDPLLDGVDCAVEEAETMMQRTDSYDDFIPESLAFTEGGGPLHDLSAWRITIVEVAPRPEPENPRKLYHTFIIEIRRIDVLEDDFEASNWRVERRYQEFYALEQKLSEFHGEFEDAILPPKKSFGTKSKDFLEARQSEFELYLQKLLTKPKLRGSELLYSFLTSQMEFSTGFDINLGKFVKTGAMKLVKERGQHLEPFLQSLLVSIESPKPKPSRFDVDSDTISISSEQMANSLFENNADIESDLSPATPVVLCPGFEYPVEGAYDTILYLIEHVYQAPRWLMNTMLSLRILFRNSIDTFLDWYLGARLDRALQEHRVIRVIDLLRDAIFFNTDPPRTDEQKKERRDEALWQLKEYIPKLFVQMVGPEKHTEAMELIFNLLQCPKLNKQLSYMLLDAVIEELFPEVLIASEDDPLRELFRAARADD